MKKEVKKLKWFGARGEQREGRKGERRGEALRHAKKKVKLNYLWKYRAQTGNEKK